MWIVSLRHNIYSIFNLNNWLGSKNIVLFGYKWCVWNLLKQFHKSCIIQSKQFENRCSFSSSFSSIMWCMFLFQCIISVGLNLLGHYGQFCSAKINLKYFLICILFLLCIELEIKCLKFLSIKPKGKFLQCFNYSLFLFLNNFN